MLGTANAVRIGMPQDAIGKKCGARGNVVVLPDEKRGVIYSIAAIIHYTRPIFTLLVLAEE